MNEETLVEFLGRMEEEAKARNEVILFTVKIDGLRENRHFTVLNQEGYRVGDFNLADFGEV